MIEGDTHTNTVEGFFWSLKTGIRGSYKKVPHKWLQGYLNKFAWRNNHRRSDEPTFHLLVRRLHTRTPSDPQGSCKERRYRLC